MRKSKHTEAQIIESKRDKERLLRQSLWAMRAAIDRYKDAADWGASQTQVDSDNYPPALQTLVDGVDVAGKKGSAFYAVFPSIP